MGDRCLACWVHRHRNEFVCLVAAMVVIIHPLSVGETNYKSLHLNLRLIGLVHSIPFSVQLEELYALAIACALTYECTSPLIDPISNSYLKLYEEWT